MSVLKKVWRALVGELQDVHVRGKEQDAEVATAIARARQESINLQVAVQSRRWTSTGS